MYIVLYLYIFIFLFILIYINIYTKKGDSGTQMILLWNLKRFVFLFQGFLQILGVPGIFIINRIYDNIGQYGN